MRPTSTTLAALLLLALPALPPAPARARESPREEPPREAARESATAGEETTPATSGEKGDEEPISIAPALLPGLEEEAAMRRWHRLYRRRFLPVKESWSDLVEALATADPDAVDAECRELARRLEKLEPPTLLPAPDPTVDLHLKRTLGDLERVVESCRRDRWFELSHRLDKARRSFSQTAGLIRRYGLEP